MMQHPMRLCGWFSLSLAGALLVSACGKDRERTLDGDKQPPARKVERIPGGGTSGGRIAGALAVFVEVERSPVEGATVVVEANGASETMTTDAMGLVELEIPGLAPPANVHVFHPDHPFSSVYGLQASVLTIPLQPAEEEQQGTTPEVATISGRIIGLGEIGTSDDVRIAVAEPFGESITLVQQEMHENGVQKNTAVISPPPGPTVEEYSLRFDVRAEGVLVRAGTLDEQQQLQTTHFGLHLGLDAAEGESITGTDIELSHALTQEVEVTATGPAELTSGYVGSLLELPNESGRLFLAFREGTSATVRYPELTGMLSGGRVLAFVSLESEDDTAFGSALVVVGGTDVSVSVPALPGVPMLEGRTLSAVASSGAELHTLEIEDPADGTTLWDVAVLDGTTANLPDVPAGFTDPLSGERRIAAVALHIEGVDFQNTRFDDLEDKPQLSSGRRTTVTLP